jgi:hypothetical protein
MPDIQSCSWLVEAYVELSTCRQQGFGATPIPLTAIQSYADRHDLGELFVRQILDIDRAYLASQQKPEEVKNG